MTDIRDIFRPDRAALAPLAGVTDSVFRRICASFGASPVVTEMISSDGFVRGRPGDKTWRMLRFRASEQPIGFQFFGSDPAMMTEAVRKAVDLDPDFIDINAGCPVKKVIARGAGSALMREPELLARIVRDVAAVSPFPVTVKIRSGWDHDSINAVEVARRCADEGAAAVIVHPRTRSQGFSGTADWDIIREVREALDVPVIGSGDIWSAGDAMRMRDDTGIHAVMVGRAAMGNPWIFRDIADLFDGREPGGTADVEERLDIALRQLDMLSAEVSQRFGVLNMRKFFGWYTKGVRGGSAFRQEVFRAQTIDEVREVVRAFIDGRTWDDGGMENVNGMDAMEQADPGTGDDVSPRSGSDNPSCGEDGGGKNGIGGDGVAA